MTDRINFNGDDLVPVYGLVDELFVTGCDVHLEQMNEQGFIMILTRGEEQLRVSIYAPGRGRVHVKCEVEEGFSAISQGLEI